MKNSYTTFVRHTHWVNALLLIAAWILLAGAEGNPTFLRLHIIFGTLALVTTVFQLVGYLFMAAPPKLAMVKWREMANIWNHRLIILSAFLAIGSGLGITLGSGLGWVPSVAELTNLRENVFSESHEFFASLLLLLMAMHVVGVLSYQFLKGNTLGRMAPRIFGRK